MRAVFGVVSLLVVVAIVGLLASKQMKAVQSTSLPASSTAGVAVGATGTPAEQSKQLQDQVRNDVAKALEQGAAARQDADK